MKITTKQIQYGTDIHTCKNCEHKFTGKACNMCGEKVFDPHQLTTKHFFHEVIDFFYHFESKVLKTIKLNFLKPGFITLQNIKGIRVPYAKPVQLYLVVAFVFYVIVSKVGVKDYIPTFGDHHYFSLSDYKLLQWAQPLDDKIAANIDSLWVKKGRVMQAEIEEKLRYNSVNQQSLILKSRDRQDSIVLPVENVPIIAYRQMVELRQSLYNHSIGTFGKTFIFILLPVFAAFLFLIFFKKIQYYGAALILATHFMIYNLCVYSLYTLIDLWPRYLFKGFKGWVLRPFDAVLYNETMAPISEALFGSGFEFFHLLFWMPWLYIAFKRLFNTVWWKNIILSYLLSRVFFYLIFGVLKKVLIAFTVYNMHL